MSVISPYISNLNISGGTFYVFTSSSNDVGMTFNNSSKKFQFSKYVLLNIPQIGTPSFNDNLIQFGAIDGALINGLSADNNVNLAQSFQNYVLNLESLLLSQPTYDYTQKQNVTERVFWKWMKEMGGIKWQSATSMQSTTNQTTNPRFVEPSQVLTGPSRYYPVVQYIGDIDIVNSTQNNVNAYTEIYIHVPTADGNTPLVLFKSVSDVNYNPSMIIQNTPTNPLNVKYLSGRNYYDTNPSGLDILAFYDQDVVGQPVSMFWDTTNNTYDIPKNWYDPLVGPNAYFTDSNFTDPTVDKIQKTFGLNVVTYQRSRLDGLQIDFNATNYKPIQDNPSLTTIQQYNSTVDAQPFEFNAVLVYYDIFDSNNPTDVATNLYGVLFLSNVEQESFQFGIPTFQKYMPNVITKLNGNSYGFKINLKFDSSIENVGVVEQAINNYSPFSMEMFMDAMNVVQNSASILNQQATQFVNLQNQINSLNDLVINQTSLAEINLSIQTLQDNFVANQALFNNTSSITSLINKNAADLAALIAGQTSISISYNLNAIQSGNGIFIDLSVPNQVTIDNINQGMNIPMNIPYYGDLSISPATITLQTFNNYFRHSVGGATIIATNDIYIQIDDTNIKWTRGQTMRLVFDDILDIQTNSIIIQTDATNSLGNGTYGVLVAVLTSTEFTNAGDRPIYDITCVDSINLLFVIDQIR